MNAPATVISSLRDDYCWSHVQSHPLIEAWGEAELWGYRLLPSEEAPA
jgi:hypothetical protein